jgi:predicted PurR-regulated permease PerM
MIKQIVIISVAIAVAVSVICYVFIDNSNKLHTQLLKNEQRTRDSLSQIYAKFVTKSDSLQAHIDTMQTTLDKQIKQFRYDLFRIKIIKIPTVNYDNISDTLLISRLMSDYKGR